MEALTTLFLWLAIGSIETPPKLDDLRVFPSREVAVMVTARTWSIYNDYSRNPLLFSAQEYEVWAALKQDAYWRWFVWDDLEARLRRIKPITDAAMRATEVAGLARLERLLWWSHARLCPLVCNGAMTRYDASPTRCRTSWCAG